MLLNELFDSIPASAPLYHFTTLNSFYKILNTNTLKAHARTGHDDYRKSVSFTRDINRTFLPGSIGEGIGFRVDRNALATRHKLIPAKHNTTKKVSHISTGTGTHTMTDTEQQMSGRFESEERVFGDIPNFSKYVTGVVVPKTGKWSKIKMPSVYDLALSVLHMSGAFDTNGGAKFAFDIRNHFLDTVSKLNVPIIFRGKQYSTEEVNRAIGKMMSMRKNQPEEFDKIFGEFFATDKDHFGKPRLNYISNQKIGYGKGTYADLMGKSYPPPTPPGGAP